MAKSGDAVSNVGKKIALSAELVEPHSSKYPTSGGGGSGGSAGGIHATIAKLISGSSGSSSSGSSGHKEVEHHGHVEGKWETDLTPSFSSALSSLFTIVCVIFIVDAEPAKSLLHAQLTKLISQASGSSSSSSSGGSDKHDHKSTQSATG